MCCVKNIKSEVLPFAQGRKSNQFGAHAVGWRAIYKSSSTHNLVLFFTLNIR